MKKSPRCGRVLGPAIRKQVSASEGFCLRTKPHVSGLVLRASATHCFCGHYRTSACPRTGNALWQVRRRLQGHVPRGWGRAPGDSANTGSSPSP